MQDTSFRHLCLKLIELGSEEHKILTFLHRNKEEAILHCVMPVLDFLDIGSYCFAIMPRYASLAFRHPSLISSCRWGNDPAFPWFLTVREAGRFIQNILKVYYLFFYDDVRFTISDRRILTSIRI